MFKLLKYEFRKALVPILIMLGLTAALQAYFLIAMYANLEDSTMHIAISASLLAIMTLVVEIFVMIRGVSSYSGELKSRSAYLIYMTPNSTMKIIGSKFLFTYVLGGLFTLLYVGLGALDVGLLLKHFGELESFLMALTEFMESNGYHLEQYVFAGAFALIYMSLSTLSFFAVAYLAITLSHTLFRDKKGRGFMALLFFVGINYAVSAVSSLFPMAYTMLNYVDAPGVGNIAAAYNIDTTPEFTSLLVYVVPQALVSLGVIILSFFGCAWMLEKKVSL